MRSCKVAPCTHLSGMLHPLPADGCRPPSRTRNQSKTIEQEHCKARAVIAAQSQRLQSSFNLLNPTLQHNSLITSQQAAEAMPVLWLWI